MTKKRCREKKKNICTII